MSNQNTKLAKMVALRIKTGSQYSECMGIFICPQIIRIKSRRFKKNSFEACVKIYLETKYLIDCKTNRLTTFTYYNKDLVCQIRVH